MFKAVLQAFRWCKNTLYFFVTRKAYYVSGKLEGGLDINSLAVINKSLQPVETIPISSSFARNVNDVVFLERSCTPILAISGIESDLGGDNLSIKPISFLHAWFFIWKRVVHYHQKLSRYERHRLGFRFLDLYFAPYKVYQLASSMRYNYPKVDYKNWRSRFWDFQKEEKRRIAKYHQRIWSGGSSVAAVTTDHHHADLGSYFLDEQSVPVCYANGVSFRCLRSIDLTFAVTDEYVLFLGHGVILETWAISCFKSVMDDCSHIELVYSDHDFYDRVNSTFKSPRFKPDWSAPLELSSHFIGDVMLVKRELFLAVVRDLGVVPTAHQLGCYVALKVPAVKVKHIPLVLWHSTTDSVVLSREDVSSVIDVTESKLQVSMRSDGFLKISNADGTLGVDGDGKASPSVAVIVPTRNGLDLLLPCIESILSKTLYSNFEIYVVDNGSDCRETLNYLDKMVSEGVIKLLKYPGKFNYSTINNFAVSNVRSDFICFLNNDTEVISPGWLTELVDCLADETVAVAGARLLFSDGRVQHAGDVVGPGGCANHLHSLIDRDDPGYMSRAVLPQDLSAVTAACMLTRKSLFEKLGGFDEANLPIAFNDVDYCLRVREAGLRVVYTPYAELYHHESVSRGKDITDEAKARAEREVKYMQARWAEVMKNDPFYNPNLNYAKADFGLARVPRVDWPWA